MKSRETKKTVHDVGVLECNPREVDTPHFSRLRRVYYTSAGNEVPVVQELHIFQVEKMLGAAQVNVRGSVSMTRWGTQSVGRTF